MVIGIDARTISDEKLTGVGFGVYNIIKFMLGKNIKVKLFFDKNPEKLWFKNDAENIIVPERSRFRWEQFAVPKMVNSSNLDIYHEPWNYGLSPKINVPTILTIHDVIPFEMKDCFPTVKSKLVDKQIYLHSIRLSAKKAKTIVTDSYVSKEKIIKYLKVPADKIKVVHYGINKFKESKKIGARKILKNYSIKNNYIIYTGGIDKRKNIEAIFYAYKMLGRKVDFDIVIVGEKNSYFQVLYKLEKELRISSHVKFTGYVPNDEMHALLSNAKMMIFPTLYEGFGIPPLEAMYCGCPVIASDIPVIRETCENAVKFIDPKNPDEIANAIYKIINYKKTRSDLITKGICQAQKYSWEKMGKEYYNLYKSVYNK